MTKKAKILFHLDDVGVSRGSVEAWKALRANDVVRSASVMVPCPWYPAARDDWHQHPNQDLGIHITLTSEWSAYRWRPMNGPVKGLCDQDGFFHKRPEMVAASADPSAVGDEVAAQIERVLADGIKPTHLDAHMGTIYLEPFIRVLLDASDNYQIPFMFCRDFSELFEIVGLGTNDPGYLKEIGKEFELRGMSVFERFLIGFCPENTTVEEYYTQMISDAGPGTHWLAMHANSADDMIAYAPKMVMPRLREADFFGSGKCAEFAENLGIQSVNYLDILEQSESGGAGLFC